MSINFGMKWVSQETANDRPHILGFDTARSLASDPLFEVWNGATDAAVLMRLLLGANLTLEGVAGLDVNPGSDVDADLLTVGVTGTPRLWWDESDDRFTLTHGLDVDSGALNASGGGALTGTWSDLGSVTTIDINGGTIGGVTLDGTISGTPIWGSDQAITLSTAAQPNVTSLGTLTALTVSGVLTVVGATNLTGDLSVGGTPAATGVIRIPNAEWIRGRNTADTGDIAMFQIDSVSNRISVGGAMQTGALLPDADDLNILGNVSERWLSMYVGGNGLDVVPDSDLDADLLTVGVTGTPTLSWDESEDRLAFTHGITVIGQVVVGETAPVQAGRFGHVFRDTFVSDGSSSVSGGVLWEQGITAANGSLSGVVGHFFTSDLTTQSNSETIGVVAQLWVAEPNITIGTDTITAAATIYVSGAPSEGGSNYAIFVDSGAVRLDGELEHAGTTLGFYGSTPVSQPTVTGSRGGNAALADLLTELATQGLIIDSSSA